MQVLDGARYIVARSGLAPAAAGQAVALVQGEAPSATLCLSLGGTAGPHDGSSMVEQALDELALLRGVDVVVAAGNLPARRSADPARWLHAQRSVKRGTAGRFLVHVSAANARHAFVATLGLTTPNPTVGNSLADTLSYQRMIFPEETADNQQHQPAPTPEVVFDTKKNTCCNQYHWPGEYPVRKNRNTHLPQKK